MVVHLDKNVPIQKRSEGDNSDRQGELEVVFASLVAAGFSGIIGLSSWVFLFGFRIFEAQIG